MSPAIILLLTQLLELLPAMIEAGIKIQGLVARTQAALASGSTDINDVQWQAVKKEVDDLTARLNADPAP